ncbi:sigma-54-dependent Fis family transcriptional regulator [Asticcacaulis sp. AC402]|uniref:sigma-54-dependent Fis family transcriptional regulator n=1 Tax=Asticcacaulis sp. AC402 TaxID=1282361 RepID=UPI0003C3ED56|nr:GAF domain-containing protein [Asticcacaulis sp. AC402]ESQ77565.1 Fis family transcriptional regulator [Asticcacaulis sp. AC402]
MIPAQPSQIEAARKTFFAGKGLPVDQIGHAILRSWIRCADMGLNESATPGFAAPTRSELKVLQERHEALRRICRPELDALYGEARELAGIVVLTNARGEILDAVGDPAFAGRAAEVALRPGAQWSEDGTGTNAIGTAIAERRAVVVNGAEHYFRGHQNLSCAATPIIDPRGATLGVLDISTPSTLPAGQMLGMVRMAVEQIEHRLFRGGFEGCQTLRFQTDPALLGAAREGILVFRDGVVVAANRRGLSLVGRSWDGLDSLHLEDLFNAAALSSGSLHGRDGREFVARLDDDGLAHAPLALATSSLVDLELATIRNALAVHNGSVSAAARQLGIHRSTIYRRMAGQ